MTIKLATLTVTLDIRADFRFPLALMRDPREAPTFAAVWKTALQFERQLAEVRRVTDDADERYERTVLAAGGFADDAYDRFKEIQATLPRPVSVHELAMVVDPTYMQRIGETVFGVPVPKAHPWSQRRAAIDAFLDGAE